MSLTVGSFPYKPGFNPYQRLITEAIMGEGVEVIRIPPKKWFPLQRAMRVRCDLLHLDWPHDWYSGKNLLAKHTKRWMYQTGLASRTDKKIVWTAHNLVAHDSKDQEYEHRMIQKLINRCDGIMTLSKAAESALTEKYVVASRTEVRTINHGHYIDCYQNVWKRPEARRHLSISDNDCVLLSLGSIRPYKGSEKLIQVFSEISRENDLLVIAGVSNDKGYEERLKKFADDHKSRSEGQIRVCPGLIADSDLQIYFNAADVAVLPFENVLNSGSLLMAMSFGMPVVAPETGSIPEIINGKWGFLHEPNNSASLKQAISEATDAVGNAKFDEVRGEVINFTRERYSWEQVGSELRDWYQGLCQSV